MIKKSLLILAVVLLIFSPTKVFASEIYQNYHYFGDGDSGSIDSITEYKGKLYFSYHYGGNGDQGLWVIDNPDDVNINPDTQKPDNARLLLSTNGEGDSDIYNIFVFKDSLFFTANDDEHGVELWKSDGTVEGTALFKDLYTDEGESSYPGNFIVNDDNFIFVTQAGPCNNSHEVWSSDGTVDGTIQIYAPCQDSITDNSMSIYGINELNKIDNYIYFTASYSTWDNEIGNLTFFNIIKTDGTLEGTTIIKSDIRYMGGTNEIYVFNDSIYSNQKNIETEDMELVTYDKNTGGPSVIKTFEDSYNGYSSPYMYTVTGGFIFFVMKNDDNDQNIYYSDGTADNTRKISNNNINDMEMTSIVTYSMLTDNNNEYVYFTADYGESGRQIWRTNGITDPEIVFMFPYDTFSGYSIDYLSLLHGDKIFFSAEYRDETQVTTSLFESDGTAEGTIMIADKMPMGEGFLMFPTIVGNWLYFLRATDYNHEDTGSIYWRTVPYLSRYAVEPIIPIDDGEDDGEPEQNIIEQIINAIVNVFVPNNQANVSQNSKSTEKKVSSTTQLTTPTEEEQDEETNTVIESSDYNIWPYIIGGIGFVGIILFILFRKKDK